MRVCVKQVQVHMKKVDIDPVNRNAQVKKRRYDAASKSMNLLILQQSYGLFSKKRSYFFLNIQKKGNPL